MGWVVHGVRLSRLVASVQVASRTTIRYVTAIGSDAGTCTNPAALCRMIQYAVNYGCNVVSCENGE